MPSNIPFARERLATIADDISDVAPASAVQIRTIIQTLLVRQQSGRRAPTQRKKVTPSIIASVKQIAKDNPTMTMEAIGRRHDIDGGRVSEILAGLRS